LIDYFEIYWIEARCATAAELVGLIIPPRPLLPKDTLSEGWQDGSPRDEQECRPVSGSQWLGMSWLCT